MCSDPKRSCVADLGDQTSGKTSSPDPLPTASQNLGQFLKKKAIPELKLPALMSPRKNLRAGTGPLKPPS